MSEEKTAPAPVMAVAWLWVGLPFAWGVYELVLKVQNLFGS
ncbi:MFS transporter small subunit [Actinomycetes bacterium M1A6_2h]